MKKNIQQISQGFDKGMMTGMIRIDFKKVFNTINHDVLYKNYVLLVFRSVLLTGLNLSFPTDLFWLF